MNKKILRVVLLAAADVACILAASFFAILVRFEFSLSAVSDGYWHSLLVFVPVYILSTLIIFYVFRLYNSMWSYASVDEMFLLTASCTVVILISYAEVFLMKLKLPKSFPLLCGIFLFLFASGVRFSYRLARHKLRKLNKKEKKRTMVIGAGEAGCLTVKEFNYSEFSHNNVICIIDDDPTKQGQLLNGVKVVGKSSDIIRAAKTYNIEEIVLAIPTLPPKKTREIIDMCSETGCALKTLPGIYQLANGEVNIQKIRDVEIEDLLGRDQVSVDTTKIGGIVTGKTVLVTGGGGSIGGELCRQLATYNPGLLIIFDIYENNAYEIQTELLRTYPELKLETLIGSVRDVARIESVFETYKPDVVFHAAAHKHVPLMEDSPLEAVKNNIAGTLNVAKAADKYGAGIMCLVSTDKAVNPTNVMGASKRCCEMIVQMMNNRSNTRYVAVRFGNVLGSHGSVIPLFRRQIAEGGPVTVTHKDIIRYFMTISEAVSLILQAAVYARGGEIFVLDMGEPVRIDDMARKMIRLSGFEPNVDIDIVYTGLRPGEKLFEELLMKEEGLKKTDNELIFIGHEIDFDEENLEERIASLCATPEGDNEVLRKKLCEIVPTYHRGNV